MLVGLINPAAGHKPAVDLAHVLASASPRLRLLMSDREDDLDSLIASLTATPAQLLVIAGGDGTVCSLVTRFHRAGAIAHLPPLLVLPAGRVNTVASALVGSRRPAQLAQRILHAWSRGVRHFRSVPVLEVQVGDQPVWAGFTVSLGELARMHRDYRSGWLQGTGGVAELVARLALQRLPPQRFAPLGGALLAEPEPVRLQQVTLGILSALPHFFGVVRPFPAANGISAHGVYFAVAGTGSLATQAMLPGLLRGLLGHHPQVQYGQTKQMSWRSGANPDLLVLDGEELTIPPNTVVTIRELQRVKMLVWRDLPA
jgi:diacylglycerol kinase family enzyme